VLPNYQLISCCYDLKRFKSKLRRQSLHCGQVIFNCDAGLAPATESTMEEAKYIVQSKTVWFNLITFLLAVVVDSSGLLQAYLSTGGYLLLMMGVSAGNVYLRTITTTPVRLK
jgi:hypothetical protein